ncbi:MAG: cytochrome c3 family protein [Coriobacteriia bacterium]|nr:cytochrome c3 family protein [Coriobacteriia bacterium]
MKRMILVAVLALAMLATMSGVAFAGNTEGVAGISQWDGVDTVHSGYAATTNACKVCHDVHGNANYKLFIDNNVSTGCSTCHVTLTAAPNVYTGATDAHVIGGALATLPDSSNTAGMLGADAVLGCLDCHNAAPHGAGAGTGYALVTEDDDNDFCLRCHDENDGRLTLGVIADTNTHVMVAVGDSYIRNGDITADDADAGVTSENCINCHVDVTDFPHSGEYKLLTAGSAADALDAECRLCHGATVGVSY